MRIGIDLDGVIFNSENYISAFLELTYMDQIDESKLNFKSNSSKKRYESLGRFAKWQGCYQ